MTSRPEDVKIYKADTRLKERVGNSLEKAFSAERVASAEKVLVSHASEFEDLAAIDTKNLQVILPKLKSFSPDIIKDLRAIAFRLKSNAGTFGYPLAGQIAKSLFDYAEALNTLTPDQATVIEKHIELLSASFRERHNDKPAVQQAIVTSLHALIKKYPAS